MQDHYTTGLYNAITGHICESREDIAAVTGWDIPVVDAVLHYVRQPDHAIALGWTVPHVPRGRGPHLYLVVDGAGALTRDEITHIRRGARSTLRVMASHGEGEGQALRLTAMVLPEPREKRLLTDTRKMAEGAAAMARTAEQALAP